MRAYLFCVIFFVSAALMAQQNVAVYTHDGSKIMGDIILRDSVAKTLKVRIQGGSEMSLRFSEIDSISKTKKGEDIIFGSPYFAFGMGASMNAKVNRFQFDVLMGYRFTPKFQGGIGFCSSQIISSYIDLGYNFYEKKYYSLGVYAQPGILLANLGSNYYGDGTDINGFYSNSGISIKLKSNKATSFSIHAGYQYVKYSESYINWNGEKSTNVTYLNRYIVQGIFAF